MMSYRIRCPHCAVKLVLPDGAIGRAKRCPKCRGIIRTKHSAISVNPPPDDEDEQQAIARQPKADESFVRQTQSKPRNVRFWAVPAVVLLISGVIGLIGWLDDADAAREAADDPQDQQAVAAPVPQKPIDVHAMSEDDVRAMAQTAYSKVCDDVLEALRVPSSAKFAETFTFTSYAVANGNQRVFDLTGDLESQNTFGVMLSSEITANLTYDADADTWEYFSLKLGDQYVYKHQTMIDLERMIADCRESERFEGSGDRTSGPFTIYSDWWRFNLEVPFDQKWETDVPAASAEVIDSLGRVVTTVEELSLGSSRLTVVKERGTFRIRTTATGKWTIVVQEPL